MTGKARDTTRRELKAAAELVTSALTRLGLALGELDTSIRVCREIGYDADASGFTGTRDRTRIAIGGATELRALIEAAQDDFERVRLRALGEVNGER